MSTRFYDTDLTEAAWALGCPDSADGSSGRATAHHQPSCRPQRYLLPPTDRLPVANVAARLTEDLKKFDVPSRSALSRSLCVSVMPCGAPG
jgi:hypothetical protein